MDIAHLHLMMNHVPVLGSLFAFLVAAIGGIARSRVAIGVGLTMLVASGLVAIPVYLTGDGAEDLVEGLPGVSEALISQHESAAAISLGLICVSGALALMTMVFSRASRQKIPAAFFGVTMLVTFLTGASMINTANLGGQIRHTEIRAANGSAPADAATEKKRGKKDEDD